MSETAQLFVQTHMQSSFPVCVCVCFFFYSFNDDHFHFIYACARSIDPAISESQSQSPSQSCGEGRVQVTPIKSARITLAQWPSVDSCCLALTADVWLAMWRAYHLIIERQMINTSAPKTLTDRLNKIRAYVNIVWLDFHLGRKHISTLFFFCFLISGQLLWKSFGWLLLNCGLIIAQQRTHLSAVTV